MKAVIALVFLTFSMILHAQPTNEFTFPLWPDGAPGALGKQPKDIPTLTPFLAPADKATGAAMVICPGGGYQHLADHEGSVFAKWLNDHGISAFVLKYRLAPDYHNPSMFQDVSRALRTVRARADEWKIDPKRIGIMGSSAGGHLASTLLTHSDSGDTNATDIIERQSSRPTLGILCYPVITMGKFTHQGSRNNLIGTNPSPELVREFSNELQVTSNTPPTFLWHTYEDRTVPVENSLQFADALRKAGVPFDLHVYQKGGHGQGLGIRQYTPERIPQMLPWTADCIYWLKQQGFAN
ncbi:MAG TPA: alpha/beta hydrolase [Candidatus Paceibacterota bacterium]|nr:alpha/beta hydrolase [Candidatus Paceibacterota bacterium]